MSPDRSQRTGRRAALREVADPARTHRRDKAADGQRDRHLRPWLTGERNRQQGADNSGGDRNEQKPRVSTHLRAEGRVRPCGESRDRQLRRDRCPDEPGGAADEDRIDTEQQRGWHRTETRLRRQQVTGRRRHCCTARRSNRDATASATAPIASVTASRQDVATTSMCPRSPAAKASTASVDGTNARAARNASGRCEGGITPRKSTAVMPSWPATVASSARGMARPSTPPRPARAPPAHTKTGSHSPKGGAGRPKIAPPNNPGTIPA